MTLDRIDFEILDALQNDARLANKELAAKVNLAPSSCLTRVRALTEAGILRGHHADVAASALGIGIQALLAIRLVKHSSETCRTLYQYMLGLPETLAVFHVTGVNDLQVHVALRDVAHLRELIVERVATRPQVAHCETSVIYASDRKHRLPCYNDHEPPARAPRAPRKARGLTPARSARARRSSS
ncbi:Lrp/AsnC family transcriptional regulator [Pendulispora albinea]|uniref:Lrp/AsnC family transcriptional regulator n=1 Tax=Pendulispora albinea TaxID=2741071 RepID=A0ABZ2LV06_9BACT